MGKKIAACLMAVLLLCSSMSALAAAPQTTSQSVCVMDADTGEILYEKDAYTQLPMASITKTMTALVAMENSDLQGTTTATNEALATVDLASTRIGFEAGENLTLDELMYCMLVYSANDAANILAAAVGGTVDNFVAMMNAKAEELGCTHTHFMNPSGLFDAEHYSSAYDMALIMAYAMENEEFKNIISTKEYQIETAGAITYLRNHNKLLWQYDGCIGGKTGFTKNSGRCLVSCAEKDGIAVAAVTLNDRNDWNDHKNLFDHAFSTVSQKEILEKNDIICTRHICGKRVNLLAGEDFSVAHVSGRNNRISCKVYINEDISGDIFVGTRVGSAQIYCGKYLLGTIPLVSGQEISNYRKFFGENFERILKSALLRQKKGQSLILCNPQNWLQNDNMI